MAETVESNLKIEIMFKNQQKPSCVYLSSLYFVIVTKITIK